MKRIKIIVLGIFLLIPSLSQSMNTEVNIKLCVQLIDPTSPAIGGGVKGPVQTPCISNDGHTLYLYTPCDDYKLRIVDDNSNVVYSLLIPSGSTQVILPNTLIGEYELQLITGNLMFYGTIVL